MVGNRYIARALESARSPFNTGKFRVQAGDSNITQITERNFGNRAAYLTFQYNYGQAPRVRQPKPDENQGGNQATFQ